MLKVLSIAGSDPSSGAGIQADLKTFQKLGVFGMAVPAALTAQNSRGVQAVQAVPPAFFSKQIDAILTDMRPDAVKTGMLLTANNTKAVADAFKQQKIENVVIDPVVRSSSGAMLLDTAGLSALKKYLFPRAKIVTPNIPEAEVLAGMRIRSQQDMNFAAERLLDLGPSFVLIKGGHRKGPAKDTLYGGRAVFTFSTARIKGDFHGTGCLLSSALTVFIAKGYRVEKAVEKAKQFVENMLKTARYAGRGRTKYFQF